jgi:hypothetical protein
MWSILIILFVLCLNSVSVVRAAGDCGECNPPPTYPGNASRCQCYSNPKINATFADGIDTIDSSHPVTLSANGGCPPYTWTTSNSNYSLSNSGKTKNDLETITLTAATGSCGGVYNDSNIVCTVTVTDACGQQSRQSTIEIRNTMGHWGNRIYDCGSSGGELFEVVVGRTKYSLWFLELGFILDSGPCVGTEEDWTADSWGCNRMRYESGYNLIFPNLRKHRSRAAWFEDYCVFDASIPSGRQGAIIGAFHTDWKCNY